MEVHHHPKVEKKHFKEYFLEFLMIFLAVTMGFFAESLRESIVNNEKELHYIKGLVQDLSKDTAALSFTMAGQQTTIRKIDSALSIQPGKLNNVEVQDTFFHHFFHFFTFYYEFVQNDNTYQQLRNAGGFSFLRNQEVIDSITLLYAYFAQQLKPVDADYLNYYGKIVQMGIQLMDIPTPPSTLDDGALTIIPSHTEFFIQVNIPLIRQLYSTIRYEKGSLLYYMTVERIYNAKIQSLINYLNKQYHLENE
jgi:hypothetical protein